MDHEETMDRSGSQELTPTTPSTTPSANSPSGAGTPTKPPSPPKTGSEPRYFDFIRHERVQGFRRAGVWCYLGERYGDLEVRLRPFYEEAVVTAREAMEDQIRMELSLADDDPIPNDRGMQVTRESVAMAVTGARGAVRASGAQLDIARKLGWQRDGEVVTLRGSEDSGAVRDFFRPMIFGSMHLTTTLVRFSRALHKVKDEEIDSLGEAFVFGRHLGVELLD